MSAAGETARALSEILAAREQGYVRGTRAARIYMLRHLLREVGRGLVRVQVRSARQPRPYPQAKQRHVIGYTWGTRAGKGARRAVRPDSFDVLALVALDVRRVAYVPFVDVRQTMQIHVSGNRRAGLRGFEQLTFAKALEGV